MEISYQKTNQLNTDIISFKKDIGIMSLLLIPSKKILNWFAKIIKWRLFKKMDKLSKLLKENKDIFPNEYYDCLEINEMIKYTLNRDYSLIKQDDFNFINDMNNAFFELILCKLTLLKDSGCEFNESFHNKFDSKYDKFNENLINFKEYFYSNIYQESFNEQDVIDYLKVAWE